MDKSIIKSFAIKARIKLIEDIKIKLYAIGITAVNFDDMERLGDGYRLKERSNSEIFSRTVFYQRNKIVSQIKKYGYEEFIEEVAYTWFNRFIALRFMEVNEYLPSGTRILSSSKGSNSPDIIYEVSNVDMDLDMNVVYSYQDSNDEEGLYRYIFLKQCNQLGELMPEVFEEMEDYSELLLPDDLLSESSVIHDLVSSIREDDFLDQVEIIGWLYQYYISEKKDEVFLDLRNREKITKEKIPAATQLFTPDWIVKYMIQNSLGLYLLENGIPFGKDNLEYLTHNGNSFSRDSEFSIENTKFIDPSMGSGHCIVYAFDIFYDAYKYLNYAERDIPKLIVENNLFGFDIDKRATQMAAFSIYMKARSKNRRIFRKKIHLNVSSVATSKVLSLDNKEYISKVLEENQWKLNEISNLFDVFKGYQIAEEVGSVIKIQYDSFEKVSCAYELIEESVPKDLLEMQFKAEVVDYFREMKFRLKIFSNRYHVVCTNPPYMGMQNMNATLSNYVKEKYPDSKSDLFSVFMDVGLSLIKSNGRLAMINQHSWMFLSSFEKFRMRLIEESNCIESLVHLGTRAFEEISGEVVQTVAFVMKKIFETKGDVGQYYKLTEQSTSEKKRVELIKNINDSDKGFLSSMDSFKLLPGSPIVYWINDNVKQLFRNSLESEFNAFAGISTGMNGHYIKYWYEVPKNEIKGYTEGNYRYVPHNKGGGSTKWYGNRDYVLNYSDADIQEMKQLRGFRYDGREHYFKKLVSWSKVTTSGFNVRYYDENHAFDSAAPSIPLIEIDYMLLGYLNSSVAEYFLDIINPTLNYPPGYIKRLPYIESHDKEIENMVKENISIAKKFTMLVRYQLTLKFILL